MDNLTPTTALALLGLVAGFNWRELNDNDYAAFAGAGEGARIAELTPNQHGEISELLDWRAPLHNGAMAVIGGETGDDLQVEIHGCSENGEPLCLILPLKLQRDF